MLLLVWCCAVIGDHSSVAVCQVHWMLSIDKFLCGVYVVFLWPPVRYYPSFIDFLVILRLFFLICYFFVCLLSFFCVAGSFIILFELCSYSYSVVIEQLVCPDRSTFPPDIGTRRPPLWSSGQSSWLQIRRPGFDSRHYQKKKSSGSGTGSTQPREYNWGATW
jgi:ribosomal protein L37E